MLHRYWLVTNPDDRYGSKNFGVTAFSPQHAKSILKEQLRKIGWTHFTDDSIDQAEVVEDIDIRLLDQNHVVPNMGVVVFQGVWGRILI